MSQVLVVVYSYTGTSSQLAQRLALEHGWPVGEIRDAKPRSGSWRCVLDSLLRRRPAIRYEGPSPEGFDAVVLVSPIWMQRLAAPMRTFVARHADTLRDVAVVSVMNSRGASKAVAEVTRLLGRRPIFEAAFCTREVEDGDCAARAAAFAASVQLAEDGMERNVRPAVWSASAA